MILRSRYWLLLIIPVIIYLLAALPNLNLPGVYYDEVLQVLPAMEAVGYDLNPDYLILPGTVFGIGDLRLPLMTTSYLGSLESMIFVVVFAFFDPTLLTVRLTFVALGLITIILTFVWVRQLLGWRGAFIATLLLATDASYVMYTRVDNGPVNTMMLIKLGMLIAFTHWWQTGSRIAFIAGAFLVGLGIYDKANFAWLIIAGVTVIVIFALRETWTRIQGRYGLLALGVVAGTLGVLPFLGYVVLSGGGPFKSFFGSFNSTSFGVDNTDFAANLQTRAQSFIDLISGYEALNNYTTSFIGDQVAFERFLIPAQPLLLLLAVIIPLLLYFVNRERIDNRLKLILALFVLIIQMVVLSTFTPTNLMSHHLVMLYPFQQVLMTASALLAWDSLGHNRLVRLLLPALLVIALISNVGALVRNHQVLVETGGVGMWSDAIYDLNSYLLTADKVVICMDWGLCHNLQMLGQGQISTADRWADFLYPLDDTNPMQELLQEDNLFVFHSLKYSGALSITEEEFARLTFFDVAAASGQEVELVQSFEQRNGEVVYEVYEVKAADS